MEWLRFLPVRELTENIESKIVIHIEKSPREDVDCGNRWSSVDGGIGRCDAHCLHDISRKTWPFFVNWPQ